MYVLWKGGLEIERSQKSGEGWGHPSLGNNYSNNLPTPQLRKIASANASRSVQADKAADSKVAPGLAHHL